MTKFVFGLLAACTLTLLSAPTFASDFSDQCQPASTALVSLPDSAEVKAAVDKKFGGDVGKLCSCMEDAVKKTPTADADLPKATAFAAAISAALGKGGATGADVDKVASDPAQTAGASVFMTSMVGCWGS